MNRLLIAILCFGLLASTGCKTAPKPQPATFKELVAKARADYDKKVKGGNLTKEQAARAKTAWSEFTRVVKSELSAAKSGPALSKVWDNPPDAAATEAYDALHRKLASFYTPAHPRHRGDL